MKQQALYKIVGMQKDVADSSMDKQHAFDIRNMRLRNGDTNTVAALVNEIGNLRARDADDVSCSIKGTVIGFTTLNDTGIIFTHEEEGTNYTSDTDIINVDNTITPAVTPSRTFLSAENSDVYGYIGAYEYKIDDGDSYNVGIEPQTQNILSTGSNVIRVKLSLLSGQSLIFNGAEPNDSVLKVSVLSRNTKLKYNTGPNDGDFDTLYINRSSFGDSGTSPVYFYIVFNTAQLQYTQTLLEQVSVETVRLATPVCNVLSFNYTVQADLSAGIEETITEDYEEELSTKQCDHIYLIGAEKRNNILEDGNDTVVSVFEYFRGDLNFDAEHPIESTVYFENDKIQKVYWVDGVNPLRYMNIADKNGTLPWTSNILFDSVPLLHLQETVRVVRNNSGGVFPSGAVQWCFTYLNRYGAESNIAWISPICYSSPDDRGGAPDEICTNSFTIIIDKYESAQRFDYIRLYSILRTTLDGEVQVRRIADVDIPKEPRLVTVDGEQKELWPSIVFTDTNTLGESVDPSELLFMDKIMSVIPNTLEQKSNTLFLGNLKQSQKYLRDVTYDDDTPLLPLGENTITFELGQTTVPADDRTGYYSHKNQLLHGSWDITSFRMGEEYRFGFQAQDKTGHWSDVWWLGDATNTSQYPKFANGYLNLVNATFELSATIVDKLRSEGYRRVRPVVVYPESWERNIVTEGLINPTVYNAKDRDNNAPFAQSSWFLRPFSPVDLGTIPTLSGAEYHQESIDHWGNAFVDNTNNVLGQLSGSTVSGHLPLPETSTWGSFLSDRDSSQHNAYQFASIDSFTDLLDVSNRGSWAEFRHNHPLGDSQQHNGEIQSMFNFRTNYTTVDNEKVPYSLTFPYVEFGNSAEQNVRNFVNTWSDFYFVDQSVVTLNTADMEFDQGLFANSLGKTYLRITGIIPITSFVSSYNILTNTPPNKFFADENNSMSIPQGLYASETVGATMESCPYGWRSLISAGLWHDDITYQSMYNKVNNYNILCTPIGFAVYPWQSTGSLNNDSVGTRRTYPSDQNDAKESQSSTGDNYISAELKSKTIANLHYSWGTHHVPVINRDTPKIGAQISAVYDNQEMALTKIAEPSHSGLGALHYFGSVDQLITPSVSAASAEGHPTNGIIDYYTTKYPLTRAGGYPIMVGSEPHHSRVFEHMSHKAFGSPYSPLNQHSTLTGNTAFEEALPHNPMHTDVLVKAGTDRKMAPIPIKYKSCSHLVAALDYSLDGMQQYFHYPSTDPDDSTLWDYYATLGYPYWRYKKQTVSTGSKPVKFRNINTSSSLDSTSFDGVKIHTNDDVPFNYVEFNRIIDSNNTDYQLCGFCYLGQIVKEESDFGTRFGGTSEEALEQNIWLPAGSAMYLYPGTPTTLTWKAGDTYYQRYDALRTYPFTEEDTNKVIDIVSFMMETHVNIDGRYDSNRGLSNNNYVRPKNFNKMNYVYSQRDNFFTYHAINSKKVHLDTFEYSFTWSLTKTAGALRDEWTRVTLASTYDCDGNKGPLNRIVRLDNNLVAFQSNGIAQILFNENVQIQGSDGVPIELANSGKMQGLRYYTTETGCQNKWSIAVFPNGIYWIDGKMKDLNMLSDGVANVSTTKLMSTWFKNRKDLDTVWNPKSWDGIISHKDVTTGELFITLKDTCLCFDTLAGEFTSFYDYQKTDAMFLINGCVLTAAKTVSTVDHAGYVLNDNLWMHRRNRYHHCRFYDFQYPFHVEIVCNSNNDGSDYGANKIFDNLSWRSDAWSWVDNSSWEYKPFVTMTEMYGFDDYQKFSLPFTNSYPDGAQTYEPQKPINLRKKFKVWSTTLPRAKHYQNGTWVQSRDRIHDTWCHMTLKAGPDASGYRHVLHDIVVSYFIP